MYKKIRITKDLMTESSPAIGDVVDALVCPVTGGAWTLVRYKGNASYNTLFIAEGQYNFVKENKPENKPETKAEVISEGVAPTNNILLPAQILKTLTVEFK